MKDKPEDSNREGGFTLLELTIALAVIATLSVGYIQWKQSVLRDANAQRTADGIVLIEEALYNYRLTPRPTPVDPDFPYEWPATLAALDSYLPGIAAARNGVGQKYELILPPPGTAYNAHPDQDRSIDGGKGGRCPAAVPPERQNDPAGYLAGGDCASSRPRGGAGGDAGAGRRQRNAW